MPTFFKAIELDPISKQRTGRQHTLTAQTRQEAVDALLALLGATADTARIDPSRTLVQFDEQLWTIVGTTPAPSVGDSAALRRAGAKHKRVR
ncbi:MAG TPA: hypothetical protein VGE94_16050 [Chloroflexota bacterium]|jgi:hypothetical protein